MKKRMKSIERKTPAEIFADVFKVCMIILMIAYVVSLLLPICWMVINSFKGYIEYYETPSYTLPKDVMGGLRENYAFMFNKLKITRIVPGHGRSVFTVWDMLRNSVILSVFSPLFSNFMFMICGYVLAKYKFPCRDLIYSVGIVVMILPLFGSSGSAMVFRKATGSYDNMFLMIVTGVSCAFSGINFLMFHSAFKGIPWTYAEAVFLDGGGHFTVFVKIMLPMIFPTFGVLSLLGFLGTWNNYELFLVWLPSYANLAFGVYMMQNDLRVELGVTTPQILAAFVIVSIPTAALYFSIQKFFISSFQVGGLKG